MALEEGKERWESVDPMPETYYDEPGANRKNIHRSMRKHMDSVSGWASAGQMACFVGGKGGSVVGIRLIKHLTALRLTSLGSVQKIPLADTDRAHCFSADSRRWSTVNKYPVKVNAPACAAIGDQEIMCCGGDTARMTLILFPTFHSIPE